MVKLIQPSMAGGEISPPVGARVDLSKRAVAVELAENFVATYTGAMDNRAGQKFVAQCKPSAGPYRIIEFEFNNSQTFIIEMGATYLRFHTRGAQILDSAQIKTITGATQANPVVISSTAHGLSNGDEVFISGIAGTTELNGRNFLIANVAANTFELQDLNGVNVDGTAYTAYTSGGIAVPPYEVVAPWAAADLFDVKYAQSGDVMTLCHPDYTPQELIRVANDDWSLSAIDLVPTISAPTSILHTVNTAEITGVITAITQADPARVTDSSHGLATGDLIHITGVVGMTEINNFVYSVTVINANEFDLSYRFDGDVDSTGFTAYTSGGAWEKLIRPREYTVTATAADDDEESLRGTNGATVTITGITQAAPPVVTFAEGHGFEDGAQIALAGIVGMTELNGLRFSVLSISATQLSLKFLDNTAVDTTSLSAYVSGGVADRLSTRAYSSAQSDWDNTINWTSVEGADSYTVYASDNGGVFGKIGLTDGTSFEDNNISPDYSLTPPVFRDPFVDLAGAGNLSPSTTGFFQQRRIFANSNNFPNRFWLSQTGHFDNFSRARPPLDDDAITASIAARRINSIEHILPLSDLIFLTSGGEYRVLGGANNVITPTGLSVSPQSYHGSTKLRPIVAGTVALFVSAGQFVRDLGFEIGASKFVGRDISVLARHLFDRREILDWDYAPSPDARAFAVMDDGSGLFLTYQPDQDVYAWTRASTRGHYKSTASIREGDFDVVYMLVERVIDGNTVTFLERLDERQFEELSDAFFVDAGLTLDVPVTITGMTAANPVVVTAVGHGFTDGDTVDISGVQEASTETNTGEALSIDYNGTGFVVANATADTFELQLAGSGYDGSTFAAYSAHGDVRKAVTTISGLWHLEGATVVVAANGYVEENLVVTDGAITLQSPASRVHIGLPYFSRLITLPLTTYADGGRTSEGRVKNISRLTVQVYRSLGLWTGPSVDQMREATFGLPALYGQPLDLVSEDIDVTLKGDWSKTKQTVLEQRSPLPLSVLALVPDVIVGGN